MSFFSLQSRPATLLLPFLLAICLSFVPGRLHCCIDLSDGILLHAGQDVAVKIERHSDLAMAQPLTGDLRMNPAGEQGCRVSVPQVMESDSRQPRLGNQAFPFVRQSLRLQRPPVLATFR